MTAIELLEEAREKIIELGDFFALKTDRSPQDAARLIREITAYLSSPPSERAKELVEDIRRTDADDAWHLTFNDAAHEIEEYVYAKNEELTKIMDEYEDKIAEMEKALNDISRCPPCRKRKEKRMKKTFEQFLTENVEKGFIDFRIRAEMQDKYTVKFYIHVLGHDSDTLDFTVDENTLTQILDEAQGKKNE